MTATKEDKAAGKHIPAPPTEPTAQAPADAQAKAAEPTPEPGPDTANGEAGDFSFEPAGESPNVLSGDPDLAGEAVTTGDEPDEIDGPRWTDEQTALGRRIAVTTGVEPSVTREEVLPSNATEKQVNEAKARLRARLTAD